MHQWSFFSTCLYRARLGCVKVVLGWCRRFRLNYLQGSKRNGSIWSGVEHEHGKLACLPCPKWLMQHIEGPCVLKPKRLCSPDGHAPVTKEGEAGGGTDLSRDPQPSLRRFWREGPLQEKGLSFLNSLNLFR